MHSVRDLDAHELPERPFVGIKVDDEDMVPENLDSVERLAAFVERKQSVASS